MNSRFASASRVVPILILAVSVTIGFFVVLFHGDLLPERFSYDAQLIERVINGVETADQKFENIATVYRVLGLGGNPILAGLLGYFLMLTALTLVAWRTCGWVFSWQFAMAAGVSMIAGAVYLGQYSKDVILLVITVLVLVLPRRWWCELLVFAGAATYGVLFRDYWVIVAVGFLILWLAIPRASVWVSLLIGAAYSTMIGVAIWVGLGLAPDAFRSTVNAGRTIADTGSIIIPLFGFGEPLSGLLNNLYVYATLISPLPLAVRGGAYYVANAVLIAAIWICVLLATRTARITAIGRRSAALLLAFLSVQAIFEPDYGSALRHLTPLLPLAVYLIACAALLRDSRGPDTGDDSLATSDPDGGVIR